jgi:hypothetical protein
MIRGCFSGLLASHFLDMRLMYAGISAAFALIVLTEITKCVIN